MHKEELAQYQRAFHYFDANSDGVIDAEELRASLATLGHPAGEAELAAILAVMDKDGSGDIDFSDAGYCARNSQPDKSGEVDIQRLQRTLAEFELQAWAAADDWPAEAGELLLGMLVQVDLGCLLEEMDRDADGTVTYEEFKALLAAA
ncbi:hypothetical protein CHLNCDRAFT_141326 [Chlorella variabilis]|uniref:EF-hand domain-containing protein n=1 Tax=Chlorella variabilis TaxID=554065 RepID=E1ZSM5_CHLVA|nr:hypothetical protein CHLNCDRAFT_141326 [Chlorella variabilis]EFN51181.1 hypothetical protein CHLNCDRAFT_141326 [Chlorella variabilis]|eukprot:XP_005843283.1 hypothetical protein CHLNCDRAFT_141326 [Chlorella variabilis]